MKIRDISKASFVTLDQNPDTNTHLITDYYRLPQIKNLFIVFVITVLLVGKLYGLTSLIGMGLSLLAIVKIILPQIASGQNPLIVILTSSIILIPFIFYLSHGFQTKTHLAIFGTFISAIITGLLAYFYTTTVHLSGFASEEASFLDVAKNGTINIQLLLLSGILIGAIGILDDVTVSQVSVVQELVESNSNLKFSEVFKRAMTVGRDHVASMVNTLILVYAGASLPLMLLFLDNNLTLDQILNSEIVAEEIVRTLVGSIGLILAVPITTYLATRHYLSQKIGYNQPSKSTSKRGP